MRTEARIFVDIWEPGSDFPMLSPGAQRLYFTLLSQGDLAHDGVLALRITRWADLAAGLTDEQVNAELEELARAAYVVVDRRSQEVLVRSYLRRDKVWKQPNVLRSAAGHLKRVSSAAIRHAIAVEVERIVAEETLPEGSRQPMADYREALRKDLGDAFGEPFPNPSPNPTNGGYANPSDGRSDIPSPKGSAEGSGLRYGERGVVTTVTTDSPTPFPPHEAAPRAASAAPPPAAQSVTQRANTLTKPYYDAVGTMCNFPAIAKIVAKAINSGRYTDDQIADALARMAADGRSVTVDALRTELDGLPLPRAQPTARPSTTDTRVTAALAAGQALKAKREAQALQQEQRKEITP